MSALYVRAARLITGRGHQVIEDAAVRVEDGRITAAGRADEVPLPAGGTARVVEYPTGTVLPGLIDAHVHLTFRRGETSVEHARLVADDRALLRGVQAARLILAAGVTTVRDCGARGRLAQALRDGVRDGLIAGPRILASGPPVTTTAGHLWALGYEADTVDEARRAVRRLAKEGADFIKVCATGGGMTPGSVVGRAQYSTAELRALVDDAHRLGRPVAAHVHGTEGIARAVEAGVDTLEHVSWLDEAGRHQAFDEPVAREMARRGVFANIASSAPRDLVERGRRTNDSRDPSRTDGTDSARSEERARFAPSGTGGTPSGSVTGGAEAAPGGTGRTGEAGQPAAGGTRSALARWEHARRMRALGVPVCFSTDAIYGWWDDGHDLTYLAQALVEAGGFDSLDVVEMVTAVPARAIGWGDRLGTVEAGKLADLLVVAGNPAADVRALHAILAVYQDGVQVAGQTQA
jgi:imidazolonepropionase-like amidohydrolase